MPKPAYSATQMMRVQARADSAVEKKYYAKSALPTPWPMPRVIAPGISAAPIEPRGGRSADIRSNEFASGFQ